MTKKKAKKKVSKKKRATQRAVQQPPVKKKEEKKRPPLFTNILNKDYAEVRDLVPADFDMEPWQCGISDFGNSVWAHRVLRLKPELFESLAHFGDGSGAPGFIIFGSVGTWSPERENTLILHADDHFNFRGCKTDEQKEKRKADLLRELEEDVAGELGSEKLKKLLDRLNKSLQKWSEIQRLRYVHWLKEQAGSTKIYGGESFYEKAGVVELDKRITEARDTVRALQLLRNERLTLQAIKEWKETTEWPDAIRDEIVEYLQVGQVFMPSRRFMH